MSLTVHHLEYSRSTRILWLLEELGLDYELRTYARNDKTYRAPPELADVHPLGRAPLVTDGELVLAHEGLAGETARRVQRGDAPRFSESVLPAVREVRVVARGVDFV